MSLGTASGKLLQFILRQLPEAANAKDRNGDTVLHHMARVHRDSFLEEELTVVITMLTG